MYEQAIFGGDKKLIMHTSSGFSDVYDTDVEANMSRLPAIFKARTFLSYFSNC